jgi:hypothetical protein
MTTDETNHPTRRETDLSGKLDILGIYLKINIKKRFKVNSILKQQTMVTFC